LLLLFTHISLTGSWLNAALYYAKSLPEVTTIVESFEGLDVSVT